MADTEQIIAESGERFAISMTVSAMLAQLTKDDEKLLMHLHALLSQHVEVSLTQAGHLDEEQRAVRESMSAHAVAAIDHMFITAKRFRDHRSSDSKGG
jgi:hypothetical protein